LHVVASKHKAMCSGFEGLFFQEQWWFWLPAAGVVVLATSRWSGGFGYQPLEFVGDECCCAL
jgi:hypothetical protein